MLLMKEVDRSNSNMMNIDREHQFYQIRMKKINQIKYKNNIKNNYQQQK